ncbi:PssE/Cps14G family polysaccharide biosynthesis glycosyltransferase [Pseudoalteromonas sp. SYSU M81236]|uniref:PssE/Cps14G family polysaccharide biosynthesis glycosyltransferase n=1 Tax=Pseudoalteromonas sp. SYSU M81236 TaxID=3447014 RepID=UPI003F10B26D
MKVLVTVGSSSFDSLIRAVDQAATKLAAFSFTFQTGTGEYKPKNGSYFAHSNEFSSVLVDADVVITHAGAGTVFELLELNKKIIVVPNFDRIDKHQSDLALYIERNNYALVCHDVNLIENHIEGIKMYEPTPYNKDSFFLADELISKLLKR